MVEIIPIQGQPGRFWVAAPLPSGRRGMVASDVTYEEAETLVERVASGWDWLSQYRVK